ncbi:MAG: hypothetical protein KIT60_14305 [Burkholderiaceae bacterium]|nr:hypothetical protein [Burkholderiaceae bacterium]
MVSALAWPVTSLVILAGILFDRRLRRGLSRLLRRVSKVKGGPLELEFSAEAAQDVKASISEDLKDYTLAAVSEYDRQARAHDLDALMRVAVAEVSSSVPSMQDKDFRVTTHVPDVVFAGFLYQLLDYQPGSSGRGRRWSERYGIIGRSWRLNKSIFANNALGAGATNREDRIHELLRLWGMSRAEAEEGAKGSRQSFLCVILRMQQKPVGLLYFDAADSNVFKDASSVPNAPEGEAKVALEKLPAVSHLAESVDKALSQLRGKGTYLAF